MTQVIESVANNSISHGMLIELTLQNENGQGEIHYISNCYRDIVYQGNTYTALAGFLSIGDLQHDLKSSNNEITISLSAIPGEYLTSVLGYQVKGGNVKLYRVFFDPSTYQVAVLSGVEQVFMRYNGYITNYSVSEDISSGDLNVSHTIAIMASSINGLLENRTAGRRTNRKSYTVRYNDRILTTVGADVVATGLVLSANVVNDPSMNRVETLHNASFDFGKPIK